MIIIGLASDNNFDPKTYSKEICKIKQLQGKTIDQEVYYKKIAKDLLKKEGFKKITEGPSTSQIKGVPFDFVAQKDGVCSLIELKGSLSSFNFPDKVQYARLYRLITELKYKKIKHNIFLLQINLRVFRYRIRDKEFFNEKPFKIIDKSLGLDYPVSNIVKYIIKNCEK